MPLVTVTVTLAEEVAPPVRIDCDTDMLPVRLPPVRPVIVNVVVAGSETRAERGTVADMVPLPMPPVKLAVPLMVAPEAPAMAAVAFTVKVVEIVAAGDTAQTINAKAKLDTVRFISLLESSTRKTLKFSGKSPPGSATVPIRRANPMRRP